jgi:hypothetical protein
VNTPNIEDQHILREVADKIAMDSGTIREIAKYGVNAIYKRMVMEILLDMRRADLYDDAIRNLREYCEDEHYHWE